MKNITFGFVLGICITVTAFHVYFYYQSAKRIAAVESGLVAVVNFINSNLKTNGQ